MKRNFFSIIAGMILALITSFTTSCVKEGDDITIINDTTIVQLYLSDTIINNNENHLHGGDTEVKGGDVHVNGGNTTITNGNNGGNGSGGENGSEPIPVIPAGYHVWLIPVNEVSLHHEYVGQERFNRFVPNENEVPIGYYDSNTDPTTLSFGFDDASTIAYSNGKEGADIDKTRDLMILRIYDEFAELEPCRKNKKWLGHAKYGNIYLIGLTGLDGNAPDQKTGRTLMGVSPDGRNIILMVAEEATTLEAYDTFVRLFPNSPVMVVGGGNSSRCFLPEWQGTKKVPLTIKVTDSMKL